MAVVVKLCHKTTFQDFLVFFSLQYILQKLPVQATRPKITNLKKVFASYCLKQDIVLRITNAQLISLFMFAYKQGFFLSRKSSFKMLYDLSNKVMVFGRYFILTMAGIKRLLVHLLIDRKEQWSRGNMGGNRTCNYKRASESDLWNLDVLMFSSWWVQNEIPNIALSFLSILHQNALFHELSTMRPRVKRSNNSSSLSSFGI